MAVMFDVAEFGQVFATRSRGAELRDELLSRIDAHSVAVIDFANVTNVSYSFADEFIGKLSASADVRIELLHMADQVEPIIVRAIGRRTGDPARC